MKPSKNSITIPEDLFLELISNKSKKDIWDIAKTIAYIISITIVPIIIAFILKFIK